MTSNHKFFFSILISTSLLLNQASAANSLDDAFKLTQLINKNTYFKDENNRTVILHGLNEVNKRPPYTPDSIGFDLNSIHFFKTYGFNVVRLGVYWSAIEPTPGFYDEIYLYRIKQTINLLHQNEIYTLIDFHEDAFSAKHESGLGAPIWAALSTDETGVDPGFPLNLLGGEKGISLATDQDFEAFWQNQSGPQGKLLQQSYNDMVKVVSHYFLQTPGIIGYEIMNEPFPGVAWELCHNSTEKFRVGCDEFDMGILSRFYTSVINSIRTVDKKRIIFYEPNVFFGVGAPSFVMPPKDNNLGFSFHNYYNENPKQVYDYAKQHVTVTRSVPFMTEFGAATANTNQLKQIVDLADQYQMSWIEWAFTNDPIYKFSHVPGVPNDPKQQGIVYDACFPLKNKNVKWDRLYAIARVYPQVVAGDIKEYQFISSTKLFTLKFVIKNSSGKKISTNPYSKIAIPRFIYPNGYKIQIQGASVVPMRNKNYLILKNDDKADEVDVVIFA